MNLALCKGCNKTVSFEVATITETDADGNRCTYYEVCCGNVDCEMSTLHVSSARAIDKWLKGESVYRSYSVEWEALREKVKRDANEMKRAEDIRIERAEKIIRYIQNTIKPGVYPQLDSLIDEYREVNW